MPHARSRFALSSVEKLAKFWPVVGVIGLRQVGKTTLTLDLAQTAEQVSLDEDQAREEADSAPGVFLSRRHEPLLIDEVQKAPKLFDAIKLSVDRKRRPGRFFLTGSTRFSAKLGIRESLAGRIGLLHLHPLTLAEAHEKPFALERLKPFHAAIGKAARFDIDQFSAAMRVGGLPVPMFARALEQRRMYWRSWLDSILYRDIRMLVGRNYNPDLALRILQQAAQALAQGELPTLKTFPQKSTLVRQYLAAFTDCFILHKLDCHPSGTGKEVWFFSDSGLLDSLLPQQAGEGINLGLARTFLLNELSAGLEYAAVPAFSTYFKSARGSPVDFIWEGVPIKVVASTSSLGWAERSLAAAMKKTGANRGILAAPVNRAVLEPKGISVLPWSSWS